MHRHRTSYFKSRLRRLSNVQLIPRGLQQNKRREWESNLCPSASTGSQVQLTTPRLPRLIKHMTGLSTQSLGMFFIDSNPLIGGQLHLRQLSDVVERNGDYFIILECGTVDLQTIPSVWEVQWSVSNIIYY